MPYARVMSGIHHQDRGRTRRYPWLVPVLLVLGLGLFVSFLVRHVNGAPGWVGAASGLAAVWTYRATRKR